MTMLEQSENSWIKSRFRAGLPEPIRKSLWRFRLQREIRLAFSGPVPPAIIFSAQKTASTAVAEALRAVAGQAVFHFHFLDADYMRSVGKAMGWRELTNVGLNDDSLKALGGAFTSALMREGRRLRVVTLVRDPIARNVSRYFENLDTLWNVERAHEQIDVGQLLAEFHQRFDHEEGINWFDREFRPVLGIDVYEQAFPHDLGLLRIDSSPYELLIMRHDLDDRLKEKSLAEFVDSASVSIVPKNVGSQKPYARVYRDFLQRLELPEKYVDHQLGSKYACHFFGADELASLRAKWLHGPKKTKQGY